MAKIKTSTSKKRRPITGCLVFILLFFILFGIVAYKKRHQIAYYYAILFQPFEQKKLSNSAFETYRMNKIIDRYDDKVFGIDISHYQRRKDFKWDSLEIKAQEIPLHFVVMRATMGTRSKDKNFNHFWKRAKQNGYTRGAYHYYRPDENPTKQANNFVNTIRLEKGDLRPILDIEKLPTNRNKKQLIENFKTFVRLVERKYGVKPIIYTYYHFYKDNLDNEFNDYPLWLANYNNVPHPHPSKDWVIWQFSEQGIIKGINTKVDLNVFNGDESDLEEYLIP